MTDDFGRGGSVGVRAATAAEVQRRLGSGEHTRRGSLIVCGHTHVSRVMTTRSPDDGREITVVNVGSVGLPAYDDEHPHLHQIETGSPHARYALIRAAGPRRWQVELRCVSYDPEPMARLADQSDRPEWARALRTGRLS